MAKTEQIFSKFKREDFSDANDPRGTFQGYACIKGYLEVKYGSIFWGTNVFDTTQLLSKGFIADSHNYSAEGCIGTIMTAREDAKGLFLQGKFHSTPAAQIVRTVTLERIDDGVSMGQSIGGDTIEGFRIFAKDYAKELPKYLAPEYLEQGMRDATMFSSIFIRTKFAVKEDSLTPDPAIMDSSVSSAFSNGENGETFSQFLPEGIENSMSLRQVSVLIDCLYWCCAYKAFCNTDMDLAERRAYWAGCLQEFADYNLKIFDYHSKMVADSGTDSDETTEMSNYLRTQFSDPKVSDPLSGFNLKEHGEAALSALLIYLDRQTALSQLRENQYGKFSGKVVSEKNHKSLTEVSSKIQECKDKLDAFLEMHKPTGTNSLNSKAISLRANALRTKHLIV